MSVHQGTLNVIGVTVKGVFIFDDTTHTFEGTLNRPTQVDFSNIKAVLMVGSPPITPRPVEFNGDFGPGGIVIAMSDIAVTINAQLADPIEPYNIDGHGIWKFD